VRAAPAILAPPAVLTAGRPRDENPVLAYLARLSDYDPQARTLRIRGKGNKERRVYAEGGADLLLSAWLGLRGEGEPEEPLFLPVRKDGKIQHLDLRGEKKASLSDQSVYQVVKRRHREAKIREVSPHDFRKTFVGDLLDAIGDLSTVQKLAGHSDPASGQCGRPPAIWTSPTSATRAPITVGSAPFEGAAEALRNQPREQNYIVCKHCSSFPFSPFIGRFLIPCFQGSQCR